MGKKVILSVSGDCGEKLIKMMKKKFDSMKVSKRVRDGRWYIDGTTERKNAKAAGIYRHKIKDSER